ncbi:hypothetical protein BGX38DRAFT_1270595 [Terfezia claveryi]|nr:hypothetical protein BGX38DRAFT_1270595 [Terfezia claveryi]
MNFFDVVKKLGNQDPTLISRISSSFICLIFVVLQHALLIYKSGAFQDGEFFNYTNSSLGGSPNNTRAKSVENNSVRDFWVLPDEYTKELAEDLKKAEQTHLIPCGYFEERSPMLSDTVSEENNVPIMRAKNDELEYSCSPANDGYDGSIEEPGEDSDEETKDEYEDSEDNDKSDADLQDDDDNDCKTEDRNSEDGL